MKKRMKLAALGLFCLLFCACSAAPQVVDSMPPETLIHGDASALKGEKDTYALYFRLEDLPYLAAEERVVNVGQDETVEMALVKQLVAGPSATRAALTPVFPEQVKVMATSKQGDLLFVTFDEGFLKGYPAERADLSGEEKKAAIARERQLCLDALTATLTDAGICSRVQVLIYRKQVQGNSLRLEEDFLLQNGSTLPLPVQTRNEKTLYVPHNAADHILSGWMSRNHAQLFSCLSAQGRPSEQTVMDMLEDSPVLTGFVLSNGHVSADGQTAIVTAELNMHQGGNDMVKNGYPLRLQLESGVWKIGFDSLSGMMAKE